MENKAFFEQTLISNVHSLAAFFYDWTTESLFFSLMKHIEGYVPELNFVCVCVCRRQQACVPGPISFACICYTGGCLNTFWHIRVPLAGIRS